MATSRGPLRLGWTLRVLSNTHSAFRKISTSAFNRNTFRVILSTQRRFYSAEAQPEEVDTKVDSPRNLLEVYEVEPTLLQGPRKKPISQDYVEQEIEKSRKIRSRVPVCINPVDAQWTPESKRVGLVGVKLGMSCLWLKDGTRKPVTLVEIKDCQVVATRISRELGGRDDATELQVGAVEETQLYNVRKSQYGHFKKYGINPKKKVASFPVTENGLLHPGTPLYAAHFYPGQHVKIQGVTIDWGFQGVMKRWKMKGQPASHGHSKTHRKMGATGGGQDPGRIWPGKRMPGHMGNNSCTFLAVKDQASEAAQENA